MTSLFINILGHNGSGKTTLAKKLEVDLGANRINADDFRHFIKENILYFNTLDFTYKNADFDLLNPLAINYRMQLTDILLGAKQSVIYEGSGFKKEWRKKYIEVAKNHTAKTVLITCTIEENELLERLAKRQNGERWQKQYFDHKVRAFEQPTKDEADIVLTYDQTNYDEILAKLRSAYDQPNSL